jgi:hypothetical protein
MAAFLFLVLEVLHNNLTGHRLSDGQRRVLESKVATFFIS